MAKLSDYENRNLLEMVSPAGDAYLIRGDLDAQIEELYSFHVTYSLTGAGESKSARFDGEHLTYTPASGTSSIMKCNYSSAVLKKSLNKGTPEVVSGATFSATLNGSNYTSNTEITSMLDSTTPTVRVSAKENGIERAYQSNTYKYYTPDVLVLVPTGANFDLTTYKSLYKTHCQTNQANLKTVDWNNGMRIAYISTDSKPSNFVYNLPSDAATAEYKFYFITSNKITKTEVHANTESNNSLAANWTVTEYADKAKLFNVTQTAAEEQAKITEPQLYIYHLATTTPGAYCRILL